MYEVGAKLRMLCEDDEMIVVIDGAPRRYEQDLVYPVEILEVISGPEFYDALDGYPGFGVGDKFWCSEKWLSVEKETKTKKKIKIEDLSIESLLAELEEAYELVLQRKHEYELRKSTYGLMFLNSAIAKRDELLVELIAEVYVATEDALYKDDLLRESIAGSLFHVEN